METDDHGRVALPGHRNQRFLMREHADGSLLLEPARVLSEAQYEYDTNPELQELLARALASRTTAAPRRTRR